MKDSDWSKNIRNRDANKCRICNTTEKLTAHHLYSKSKYTYLKYHPNNGVTLCESCHCEYHQDCQEITPYQFVSWSFKKLKKGVISCNRFTKIANLCKMAPSLETSMEVIQETASSQSIPTGFQQYRGTLKEISVSVDSALFKQIENKCAEYRLNPSVFLYHLAKYHLQQDV
jgi:hypothetical protein